MTGGVIKGLFIGAALLAVCALASGAPAAPRAVSWPFVVAERSATWVRPSPAQQREVWDSPRFGGPNGRPYYAHDFFLWPEGADVPEYIDANAGITDAQGHPRAAVATSPALGAWHAPDIGATRGVFPGAAFLGFYSLRHTVGRVQASGNVITAVARPQAKGFEKVLLPWPAGAQAVTLKVVTPDGKVLWQSILRPADEMARTAHR